MKQVILGGLSDSEARTILIDYAKQGLMLQGGYKPKQLSVTPVAFSTGKALAMLRNKPVFHMSIGHYDACTEYLRESGMPCHVTTDLHKTKVGSEIVIRTNTIQLHVNILRKYVQILDKRYEEGAKYD